MPGFKILLLTKLYKMKKNISTLSVILFSFFILSCNPEKEAVDLIVHNPVIYTIDEGFSVLQAFAVKDSRFIEVGSDRSILSIRKF